MPCGNIAWHAQPCNIGIPDDDGKYQDRLQSPILCGWKTFALFPRMRIRFPVETRSSCQFCSAEVDDSPSNLLMCVSEYLTRLRSLVDVDIRIEVGSDVSWCLSNCTYLALVKMIVPASRHYRLGCGNMDLGICCSVGSLPD